jgi:hypothetical protein
MDANSSNTEIERLRGLANDLLERAKSSSSAPDAATIAEKAAASLKLAAEIERIPFDIKRASEETEKLRRENKYALSRERSEKIRDYVALLTPIVTVVALAATLATQSYQFARTERAKQEESLDLQWRDALKTASASGEMSPGVIAIQPFLRSEKYGPQAKDLVVNLLSNSSDTVFFHSLFGSAFTPVTWDNVERIVQVNRAIAAKAAPVLAKSWDPQKRINDINRLSPEEQKIWHYQESVLPILSAQIGALLKTASDSPRALDLSAATILRADWRGLNLKGVKFDNAQVVYVDLQDADFSDVTSFSGSFFFGTAWWNAKRLNKELFNYLLSRFPYDASVTYGSQYTQETKDTYDAQVKRLAKSLPP